jgi:hypothetical protein
MIKQSNTKWTGVYSSSISNWHKKLDKRLKLRRGWRPWRATIFIGLYHPLDYLRFIFTYAPKKVFWCGSDILTLEKSWFWKRVVSYQKAIHYCENSVEERKLSECGIFAPNPIQMIFDDPDNFQPQKNGEGFFTTSHFLRDKEYLIGLNGLPIHVYYDLSEEQFNERIKYYKGSVRANDFDGFSEITAKSILLGQYPVTKIYYPGIDCYKTEEELVGIMKDIKTRPFPNPASEIWRKRLEQSKQILLS